MTIETAAAGSSHGARPLASRFVNWWFSELAAMVPKRLRGAGRRKSRTIAINVSDEGIRITETTPAGRVGSDHLFGDDQPGLAAARTHLNSLNGSRWRSASIGVRFPHSVCYARHFRIAEEAIPELDSIAAAELRHKTPFDQADVVMDYFIDDAARGDGKVTVNQLVVKTSALQDALQTAQALGVRPKFADVVDTMTGDVLPVDFLRSSGHDAAGGWWWKTMKILLIVAFVLAGAVIYLAFKRQDAALARLEVEIARTKSVALDVRRAIEQTSQSATHWTNLRLRKVSTVSLIQLWEELTRALPDSAWLVELQVREQKAQITGFAHSAASLIGILERSPYFASVEFGSQVNFDPSKNKERFNISFQLERLNVAEAAGPRAVVVMP